MKKQQEIMNILVFAEAAKGVFGLDEIFSQEPQQSQPQQFQQTKKTNTIEDVIRYSLSMGNTNCE